MSIPKGYKLVPTEPTREMCLAAKHEQATYPLSFDANSPVVTYRAMLTAAPTPPQPIYDEAKERELFEVYATTHYRLQELPLEFDDGEYLEPEVQYSWESWEARAKAKEVDHE